MNEGMATGGPAASTIDGDSITSSSSRARNPSATVKHQQMSSAPEAHGFRPSAGIAVQGAMQSQGHHQHHQHHPSSISSYQSTSLQHQHQHLQESPSGGQSVAGHFSVSNSAHLSSSHQQRPHHHQQHVTTGSTGNPRHQQQQQQHHQHHQHNQHPAQVIPPGGLSSKLSRSSQVQVSRQSSPHDDRVLENRSHPVVTRPVANMGQLQGVAAAIAGGSHLGKQQNHLVLQRPQQITTTPQDKGMGGVASQKQQNSAQKQGGMQRVHPRSSNPGGGWQQQPPVVALGGQHGHVSPAGQSRLFYQHPVLNSQQPRSSPQEQQGQGQGRQQHLPLVGVPQQYAMPQQQMRDGLSTGSKPVPMYPVLRTPVAANHTPNHVDTGYRERLSDSQIIVHIGDRKIRLLSESDPSSLYSLCRRWVRNDVPRKDRPGLRDIMNILLPRPLSVSEVDKVEDATFENDTKGDAGWSKSEVEKPIDLLTEEELLQSHIQQFKTVRKRSREERMRRIARFKPRLALLLPGNNESN